MNDLHIYEAALERYKDLLRHAEQERLVRRDRPQPVMWFSRISKLLTRFSHRPETPLSGRPLASVR